jgi:hypothetical protein
MAFSSFFACTLLPAVAATFASYLAIIAFRTRIEHLSKLNERKVKAKKRKHHEE